MTFATLRSFVGIAKEATKGTAVPPTAFLPVKTFNPNPKQGKLIDQGWRGSMGDTYGIQNGTRSAELDLGGDVFVDTFGYALTGILGDLATTGVAVPYTHKMALKNSGDGQPVSYTFTDTQAGIQARAYAGFQWTELTLKFDASGLLTWTGKGISWIGQTAAQPTSTFSGVVPMPSWLCAFKLAGVQLPNVQSAEFTIKRNGAAALFGLGVQDPYSVTVGGIEVTGKVMHVAVDESPYLAYANNSGPGAILATFSQGANAQLILQATNAQYDMAKPVRGKSYVEWDTTFKAILNTTDVGASGGNSPILATLVDAMPAGTFG